MSGVRWDMKYNALVEALGLNVEDFTNGQQRLADMWRTVRYTFDCMGIAERVIAAHNRRCDRRHLIRWENDAPVPALLSFAALRPSELLIIDSLPNVYLSHCEELSKRALAGQQDLSAATDAEVLCSLLRTSLRAPLEHYHQEVAEVLFFRVFGEEPPGTELRRELKSDHTHLLLAQLKHQLRAAKRTAKGWG